MAAGSRLFRIFGSLPTVPSRPPAYREQTLDTHTSRYIPEA